jgi:putative heme-binding domain-containing protein
VSACVIDHFFHMAPGGIYARQGGAPENPYAYELLPSIVKHKHFRAAYAGVQIYQGGKYPQDTWGHAFIGNIHDNAIHEEVITPVGASFKCEPRRDFLRANDGWFRPVSTQTGPDGFLWVMDWCDKYPCYQNAKANPEGVDRARGRIWRVVNEKGTRAVLSAGDASTALKADKSVRAPVSASGDSREMDLKKLATPELVKLLEHSNSWMRRMARRMIVERKDSKAKEPLQEVVRDASRPMPARLESLWTLADLRINVGDDPNWGVFTPDFRNEVASSKESELRAWTIRLAAGSMRSQGIGSAGKDPFLPDLSESPRLAGDADPTVRLAMATTLREHSANLTALRAPRMPVEMQTELENLIKTSAKPEDRVLPFMIWSAFEHKLAQNPKRWVPWLATIAPQAAPLTHELAYKAMRRLTDTRDAKNLDLAVAFCEKIQSHDILLAHALGGLVKGQESGVLKPTVDAAKSLTAWRASDNADVRKHAQSLAVLWGDEAAIAEALVVVHSANAKQDARIQALQTLRRVNSDLVRKGLVDVLSAKTAAPSAVVVETIRAIADLGGGDVSPVLIKLAASKDAGIQLAAYAALAGRAEWTHAMLDAIKANKLTAVGFPISVRRSLATSKDKKIRDHAFEVLGAWKEASDDIKALIAAKRKACLEGEPDMAMGKVLFTSTCATCHAFHGGGQKVGPELIGSGRSNLDALLANVIDPNQIIGNGYEAINVTTKDNRVVSGRMIEDTPGHVKLLAIGGAEQIVPRDQIAKLENTKQSTMPMGFGNLPDDAFRSLMWYILAPPEEGPLTKEKKAALSANIDAPPARRPTGPSTRAIDWESVSLWNPQWKVNAPDFERTPVKLADFHGRSNVLLMHPFTKDKSTSLERTMKLEAGKPHKLTVTVAAHDQGDWELRVKVNGQEVKKTPIGHDGERWKTVTVDLSEHAGKEVRLVVEGAANGWSYEFGYWGEVKVE